MIEVGDTVVYWGMDDPNTGLEGGMEGQVLTAGPVICGVAFVVGRVPVFTTDIDIVRRDVDIDLDYELGKL